MRKMSPILHKKQFPFTEVACVLGCVALLSFAGCASDELDLVWPISGNEEADRLSSGFGPRIKASADRYDYHRGIDIPADVGTDVHAIADGRVIISGFDSNYDSGRIIQLRHCAQPGVPYRECKKFFYSNYAHLSDTLVDEREMVERGQVIAKSGQTDFPHLHFEIRKGGDDEHFAMNPLSFLPYNDDCQPKLTINDVDFADRENPEVRVTVRLPPEELDFLGIEAELYDGRSGEFLSSQRFDVDEWNRLYADSPGSLDNRTINGMYIDPEPFGTDSRRYEVHYTFQRLVSSLAPEHTRIVIRSYDTAGGSSITECYPCTN